MNAASGDTDNGGDVRPGLMIVEGRSLDMLCVRDRGTGRAGGATEDRLEDVGSMTVEAAMTGQIDYVLFLLERERACCQRRLGESGVRRQKSRSIQPGKASRWGGTGRSEGGPIRMESGIGCRLLVYGTNFQW